LRVIKDRIDSGEIDPTGEQPRPRGIKNVGDASDVPRPDAHPSAGRGRTESSAAPSSNGTGSQAVTGAAALFQRTDGADITPAPAPEAQPRPAAAATRPPTERSSERAGPITSAGAVLPGLLLNADEICAMAGITRAQLAELESFGVLAATSGGADGVYDEDAVEIATLSKHFLDAGIEPRHLRGWRVAADREAGLLQQLIQPLLRQRNPEARAQAVAQLDELEQNGGRLRAAMMRSTLRHHVH
jgi:hypothetical protein